MSQRSRWRRIIGRGAATLARRGYFLGGSVRSYDEYLKGMQRSAARMREERCRRRSANAQFDPAAFRRAVRSALGAGSVR